ncbi:MAG: DUF2130 domain-containing protein [Treponema sp.]|jgi:hypothetical protein|nr:DUF2130 domain-containing protein [Treponema sp.]
MEVVEKIRCPQCGAAIDVSTALRHEVETAVKREKEREYAGRLSAEIEKARLETRRESEEALKTLEETLKQKTAQVNELNKTRAELARIKSEKDELAERISLEKEAELAKKLKAEREANKAALEAERARIKQAADEASEQRIAELQKKLADQTALAAEMKRKAEQGSMQLQGEVQELAIEEILRDTFRFDLIEEVKKGQRGADVMQRVRDHTGGEAGLIIYESKRTKNFDEKWIGKLKDDGALARADVCVLVTEALPEGIENIGQKEGVWVCSFHAFKGLALVLRDSLIKVNAAFGSQINKGEKTQMLYDYLTGKEFAGQITAILEGFMDLQKGYMDERSRMEKIWKERDKQLEKVLLNANSFLGSIKGIAGKAFSDLPALEDHSLLLPG